MLAANSVERGPEHPFCHNFSIYRPEAQECKGGTLPDAPLMIFAGRRSGHCRNRARQR
jgi:hypothetical protein